MRSLLAYLPTYPLAAREAVTTSVAFVAARLDARVLGLITEPVFKDSASWALSDMMMSIATDVLGQARQSADALQSALDAAAEANSVQVTYRTVLGGPPDFQREVGSASRVHDLTVMELHKDDSERFVAEAVVFHSRRPLLILPADATRAFHPHRVVVAWDGGAASAGALTAALPWLVGARSVQIVSIAEDDKTSARDKCPEGATAEDAADYLGAHGADASVLTLPRHDRTVDDVLFDHAMADGADLVVLGAYGHSRAREFVLGGVTRRALSDPRLPMLMAH